MDYLIEVVTENHTEEVERLLDEGFDINYKLPYPYTNKTVLHLAASCGLDKMVEKLIRQGANINACDYNLRTPLHEASAEGHKKVVEVLVDEDAAIDAKDSLLQTPLFLCLGQESKSCQADHMEIIKLLVDKGADINAKDRNGDTPLHFAIKNDCSKETVELLIKLGANWSPLSAILNDKGKWASNLFAGLTLMTMVFCYYRKYSA